MAKKPSHINPGFRKKALKQYTLDECIEGMNNSEFSMLAYLISKAESSLHDDQKFIRELLSRTHASKEVRKIAISGPPGVGKSSFIDSFVYYLLEQGKKVAVLPVDPSSYISKGSILGDKTRMDRISVSDRVFIKPMSSSLALGGLAPSSAVAIRICERSDFDYILLETVGVGQSEVEARMLVDMFILLLQAGGGDDLQGIKRGIMELADLMIVTKADGSMLENASKTIRDIKQISSLLMPNNFNWHADVLSHSSELDKGNDKVLSCIEKYYDHMGSKDSLSQLRRQQESELFEKQSKELVLANVMANREVSELYRSLRIDLNKGMVDAVEALQKFEEGLNESK